MIRTPTDNDPSTTVSMIDDVVVELRKIDKKLEAIARRLNAEQMVRFDGIGITLDTYSAAIDLKAWADEWQAQIDAGVSP
jgi:hypothetical protein